MTAKLSFIALLAALTTAATAQTTPAAAPKTTPKTTASTTTHHAATTAHTTATTAAPACSKLPELSPKIPALPPGTPCAKPLYTIVSEPSVKLQYVSPLEGPALRETLGLEPTSFSLDYIDTKIGTGELAAPHKWYTIHYTGYLTDGTKFDSSLDRGEPISIPYGQHQVIPGWDTGFDGMRVGGKRRLFIPYQLAYGANAQRQIPAKSELVFDVELVSQSDEKPQPKAAPAPNDSTTPAKPVTPPPTDPAKPSTNPPPADPTKPETTPHPQSL
ncbi:MAG TPA: FKBP-type peptidyl-prolyl cis-trans isomerase [Edaphobacter sp.]|jgi:peptidylprolyl isomerase|nr:FKBP-type peptidyl-prolyl cis-trans isomerase [Edaphobacter sp.]